MREGFKRVDDFRWCQYVNNCAFNFIEVRSEVPGIYAAVTGKVDLYEYDDSVIEDAIRHYGYDSEEDLKHRCRNRDSWTRLEAEYLFRSFAVNKLKVISSYNSHDKAVADALEYIRTIENEDAEKAAKKAAVV